MCVVAFTLGKLNKNKSGSEILAAGKTNVAKCYRGQSRYIIQNAEQVLRSAISRQLMDVFQIKTSLNYNIFSSFKRKVEKPIKRVAKWLPPFTSLVTAHVFLHRRGRPKGEWGGFRIFYSHKNKNQVFYKNFFTLAIKVVSPVAAKLDYRQKVLDFIRYLKKHICEFHSIGEQQAQSLDSRLRFQRIRPVHKIRKTLEYSLYPSVYVCAIPPSIFPPK